MRFKTRTNMTRLAGKAAVYATGSLEKTVHTILRLAGDECMAGKSKRVSLPILQQIVLQDPDLSRTFAGFSFASSIEAPKAGRLILTKMAIAKIEAKKAEAKAMAAAA